MLNNKVSAMAFLISLAGHCLFLGSARFNFRLPDYEKQSQALAVELEIERTALLPRIDFIGQEDKFKEVKQIPKQTELKPVPQSEQISVKQMFQERIEEKSDVTNTDKDAMLRYQFIVKQRIEESRRYPLWAKKRGIEGITALYFTVLAIGTAQDVRIVRSSGSSILDEEAVATVTRAQPFPDLPKEISGLSVDMEVAIVFSLDKN